MKRSPYILATLLTLTLSGGCFLYNDYEFNNPYDPDRNVSSGEIASAEGLIIDGDTSDWDAISPVYVDSEGDLVEGNEMPVGGDLYQIKMAEDDNNIYLYISTHGYPPCQSEELHIHVNMNGPEIDEEGHGSHLQIFSMSHDVNGTYNTWMGYENESTNWEWTNIDNPQIRFAGMDTDANALEVAIYKGSYLENLEYGTAYELGVDVWYESESRTVDDTNNAPSFVLRPTWQTDPDIYGSLLLIPTFTPADIDGDSTEWPEETLWHKDLSEETDDYSENNTDIDTIRLSQDENFLYAFLTFRDSYGSYDSNITYNLNIENRNINYSAEYRSEYESWLIRTNADGTDYYGGWAASNDAIGLEMALPKFPGWESLIAEELQNLFFSVNNSVTDCDQSRTSGIFKMSVDAAPFKPYALFYNGNIDDGAIVTPIPFYSGDAQMEFVSDSKGFPTFRITLAGDHALEFETDDSFWTQAAAAGSYTTDAAVDRFWFSHPVNDPSEIQADTGWAINFTHSDPERLEMNFNIHGAGVTSFDISGNLYYYY